MGYSLGAQGAVATDLDTDISLGKPRCLSQILVRLQRVEQASVVSGELKSPFLIKNVQIKNS